MKALAVVILTSVGELSIIARSTPQVGAFPELDGITSAPEIV